MSDDVSIGTGNPHLKRGKRLIWNWGQGLKTRVGNATNGGKYGGNNNTDDSS